jgi:hypothetical protein
VTGDRHVSHRPVEDQDGVRREVVFNPYLHAVVRARHDHACDSCDFDGDGLVRTDGPLAIQPGDTYIAGTSSRLELGREELRTARRLLTEEPYHENSRPLRLVHSLTLARAAAADEASRLREQSTTISVWEMDSDEARLVASFGVDGEEQFWDEAQRAFVMGEVR